MNKFIPMKELAPLISDVINQGKTASFTTAGTSMKPMLGDRRDQVFLVRPVKEDITLYDLPLYQRQNGQYVLHRIVGITPDGYVMRGDHQYTNEEGISFSQIIGVTSSFCRKGKHISCKNPLYRIYVRVWVHSMPLRLFCHRIVSCFHKAVSIFFVRK